jgi:glutamine synthetase
LQAGVHICGTNAEVMPSQWEFQIGACDMLTVSDDLLVARFLLHKITEKYSCSVSFHPKLLAAWNGSGGHTNFSTKQMREKNGLTYIIDACEKLSKKHAEHIAIYGKDNHKRLTGLHETSSMEHFTWGKQDRNCSVRIPLQVCIDNCGYLEDRRPASNMDPYLVTEIMVRTMCSE